jgi:hypothetical protein
MLIWILLIYIWMPKVVCKTDGRKSKAKGRDYIVERNWMFLSIALYVCLSNDEFIFTINLPKRCFSVIPFCLFVTVLRRIYAY